MAGRRLGGIPAGPYTQRRGAGISVMRSGVVAGNNYRPLGRDEFREFSISDDMAPLIFINAHDFKGAQTFTLAHELAHIWTSRGAYPTRTTASPNCRRARWRYSATALPPRRWCRAGRSSHTSRGTRPYPKQRSPTCADTLMCAASTFIGCSGNGKSLGTADRVCME